jgi:hypothetical protein
MGFCRVRGKIDLFLFPDFDQKHRNCPNTPAEGTVVRLQKTLKRAPQKG